MDVNLKTSFLDSLEFEAFCSCSKWNYKEVKNINSKLQRNEKVTFEEIEMAFGDSYKLIKEKDEIATSVESTDSDQDFVSLQFWKELLKKTIQENKIDDQEYQLVLSKLKLDPELLITFERLGISILEQDKILAKQGLIAMDYVVDSTSVYTSFQAELQKLGIIFCPISEAIIKCPDLVQKYLGSVVPFSDNYFASLNSSVFSDGSFCYIPPNTKCPMELSTYFRINASGTGQFERTLIIADSGSTVSYLEGCTAPARSENQLHSAVVELIALEGAKINYSTVQNWYSGDKNGLGGVYNFVTKRGICLGKNSHISWTQVETGSAITWKYPSVILRGDGSTGEFYSIAITDNYQQADTGSKMIHIGSNTRSKIISKGISKGYSSNSYRGKIYIAKNAKNAKNYTKCDSMFIDPVLMIQPNEIQDLITTITNNVDNLN
jgi:FeS assembly protein SufB